MNDLETIGSMLKHKRREERLTLDALVRLTGLTRKTLIRLEKGEDVHFSTVEKVSRMLGMKVAVVPTTIPAISTEPITGEDDDWV